MPDLALWQWILLEVSIVCVGLLASRWKLWRQWASTSANWVSRLSAQPVRCFVVLFVTGLTVRLLFLPLAHIPIPLIHDEFSYLLGADTFFHGRLTNPTPPLAVALETIHTNMWPTYQSMYMPGPALLLWMGKLLGSPWVAVLLSTALFPALLYWALSAWLPRADALVGAGIALFMAESLNSWFDNYFCLALSCIGTTLILGALPRIGARPANQRQKLGWAAVLGVGLLILMLTRPYEGFCVAAPCVLVLLWTIRREPLRRLAGLSAVTLTIVASGFAWLLFYNWRGTGHPLLFPYMLNFREYHITGPFLFSARHPLPTYRNDMLRRFYPFVELPQYEFMRSQPLAFLAHKVAVYYTAFAAGFGLLIGIGLLHLARRWREHLLLAPVLGFAGFSFNVLLMAWSPFPQYAAPAAPLLYLLAAFGIHALRFAPSARFGRLAWDGRQVVLGLLLGESLLCLSLFGYRVSERLDYLEPQYVSKDRAHVAQEVLNHPGKQLCLVRYTEFHDGWQEWVFNGADPENERLLWARSLDPDTDREVIAAYPGRTVWLVRPDDAHRLLQPYSPSIPFSAVELDRTARTEPEPVQGER